MSELEQQLRELVREVVRVALARLAPTWDWLTVPEVAALLGCGPKAIYGKFDRGVLTKHKFDGTLYASRRELDELIRKAT